MLYETQGASVHIHLVYSASYDFPRPSDLELHTQEKTTDSTTVIRICINCCEHYLARVNVNQRILASPSEATPDLALLPQGLMLRSCYRQRVGAQLAIHARQF